MQKTMKKLLSIILAILMIVTSVPFAFAAESDTDGTTIVITMTDSYGDGWNGNAIKVGFISEGVFTKIADATIDDGANATYETVISDGEVVAFRWTKGSFPDECSFTISVGGEIIFEKSDCSDFADNEFIYIDCNHNYTDSVCSICGLTCGVDFSHKMNGGECTTCGYVCFHNYTNHYCVDCGNAESGCYAGACGVGNSDNAIWSLDSEGTLTISGEGEYDVLYLDAPWKAYKENIKNVVIEEGITNIDDGSLFYLPNAVTLSIPSTVTSIGIRCNNDFAEIKVAEGNNYYSVIDGVLFNYDKTDLIMYPAKKTGETYTVPDNVTTFGKFSFAYIRNLKTINISDDVTTIKNDSFSYSSIENINFGKKVEVVEYNAFLSTGLKTMVLPEKLTEIPSSLFYGCVSLENLVIGSKITSIDNSVIQYCNKLKTVHFTGTEEQWQAITKPDNTEDEINTVAVHCGALEEKDATEAACGEAGHTAGLYCDECNAYLTGEEIPATGNHTYVDGKCECGDECKHPGQTGAECEICGSALHVCDFSGEWNYSDEDHWKECSCGEISAEAEHTFTDGKCDCGYVCDHAGQTGICTICGMTLHVCDFSGEWQYDSEKHWKECTCGETSEEAEHTYTDGKCDCGFECPHEETYNNIIRPVQNADGTWGKGTVETICNICTKVTATKEVERADYTAADAAVAELKELLETEDLLDAMKNIYTKRLNISLSIIGDDKIESEQNYIDDITQGINKSIDEIKEGLKDGTMVKADFTYMGSLLDEVKSLTDNNPDSVLIPSMVEIYIVCNNIYNGFANDSSLSQSYYDEKIKEAGFEAQLEALIEAIKDGTAVKVDGFTVYNERGREWLLKFADEGIFEKARELILNSTEVKAKMDEIYDFALSLEGNVAENAENIAKIEADVDEFFGQLKKCIYGIHNVSQYKEISPAKCGENAVESATCTLCGETNEREVENSALTHSFTKYEEVEAPKCGVEGKEVAYCDNGCGEIEVRATEALKHSFTKYEVTEEAKCGVEGKEVAYCDNGCGETDEKAIEALKHSFTKYEVTEEAKCGVEGKKVATCDNGCGETDEKAIEALEHLFIDYIYNEDATCTADGTKTAECVYGCGETDTVTAEDTMLDHVDEDGDKICDDCEAEIKDKCPDCGGPAHEETGVPQYICMLITLIKLVVSLVKALQAVV